MSIFIDRIKVKEKMYDCGIKTQLELELLSGLSHATVSSVMNGKSCRYEIAAKLAKTLKTKPEFIISNVS